MDRAFIEAKKERKARKRRVRKERKEKDLFWLGEKIQKKILKQRAN